MLDGRIDRYLSLVAVIVCCVGRTVDKVRVVFEDVVKSPLILHGRRGERERKGRQHYNEKVKACSAGRGQESHR